MPAAADLDALTDRFGNGRLGRARGTARRGGPGRAGAPCLADDVRQRLEVVGALLRRAACFSHKS